MREESNRPARRVQDRGEGRRQGGREADTTVHDRAATSRRARLAVQPLREALSAALHQRAARDQPSLTLLVGHICEHCWDAPALRVQPAPWGGEMGVCGACQQETPAGDEDPQAG
jgi:hypothetical protein